MCVCRRFPGAVSAGDVRRRLPSDADGIRTRPVRQAGRRRYLASLPSLPRPDNFIVIAMLVVVVVVVVILLFATFPTFVCDKMECVLTTTCLHMSRKAHMTSALSCTLLVIPAVLLKLKDFSRSQAVTYRVKVRSQHTN